MNHAYLTLPTMPSDEQRGERDSRLHGRRLFLARVFWGIVASFELAAFVDSLSGTVSQLQVRCTSSCTNLQLSAAGVSTLQHLGLSLGYYIAFYLTVLLISTLLPYTVAAVLLWRRSDDWMALLVSLMLMSFGPGILSNGVRFSQWFGPALAGHVSSLFDTINLTILVLSFFLFPTGRFVPRWTRWIMCIQIGLGAFLVFFPRFASDLVNNIAILVFFGVLLSLIIAQVYRYRRVSTPAQRQQTKWIVHSLAVTIILTVGILTVPQVTLPTLAQPGTLLASVSDIVANALLTLIPISFGVAILRYRLYDIDLLINRTLVYGSLTALLALLYVGLIVVLQSLFQEVFHQNNAVAIVTSTLVIATLFQPLRHRIQAIIDRRFYRRKYNAAKTLEVFSATLRNEVELRQLREHLLNVVQETMQPTHVSLWLRPPAHDGEYRTPWRAAPPVSSEGK
ncbi:MAG TPA: hypothetical protein VF043_15145 [Ktedonobacteraceae bacterium]